LPNRSHDEEISRWEKLDRQQPPHLEWLRRLGSACPLKRKALGQLAVSDRITAKKKKFGGEAFGEIP
jgi:hypothetical protein